MKKLKLLLHCCCAPCASSVIERLLAEDKYDITLYYSNSNILPKEEYLKRKAELVKLQKLVYPNVNILEDEYYPQEFFNAIKGKETLGEGSARCEACIEFRLTKTAIKAKELGFDLFASTLSVSPHKNAQLINQIGSKLCNIYDIEYLPSDFKKKNGYLRSIELCKKYNIYRQNYCGCNL